MLMKLLGRFNEQSEQPPTLQEFVSAQLRSLETGYKKDIWRNWQHGNSIHRRGRGMSKSSLTTCSTQQKLSWTKLYLSSLTSRWWVLSKRLEEQEIVALETSSWTTFCQCRWTPLSSLWDSCVVRGRRTHPDMGTSGEWWGDWSTNTTQKLHLALKESTLVQ